MEFGEKILDWLEKHEIKVAALQETKLKAGSTCGNYTLFRKDREKNSGGGLAFLVHKSIQFEKVPDPPPDPHLESQTIKVDNLLISNI